VAFLRSPVNICNTGAWALFLFLVFFPVSVFGVYNHDLDRLLRLAKTPPEDVETREKIDRKGEVLYCTGESPAARANNEAADLIQGGKNREAVVLLEESLKRSPLFFPFRYNLGIAYLNINELRRALLHFTKAKQLVPEYSSTWVQIGYIYDRWNMDSRAIEYFREALRRNSKELDTFVLIGDIFFRRNQLEIASQYYEGALAIDPLFPNAILGRAKILFKRERYWQAIVQLKSMNIEGEYDKAYHYYYAEAAFKMQDYATARDNYGMLLQFENDRFFLTHSIGLIRHKYEISGRFAPKDDIIRNSVKP
jgi:tetratricopeptide (TPR) repeat protein